MAEEQQAIAAVDPYAGPIVSRGSSLGRKFRALVIDGASSAVEELSVTDLPDNDVVVRTQAVHVSYTMANWARRGLGLRSHPGVVEWPLIPPYVLGHYSVGIVESVGSQVRRTQPGDRVIVAGTPVCGVCYACNQGRQDRCQFMTLQPHAIAARADGTPVSNGLAIGGMAELTIAAEEFVIPIFSDLPSIELAMIAGTPGMGLGAALTMAPVEPGSNVAIFGCGPLGLGAVQGARMRGASQIIAIEPIRARREAALAMGATVALDPNDEEDVVDRIRSLCESPNRRYYAGGRAAVDMPAFRGADFTIEAVGGDLFPPQAEEGPDPTGIQVIRQALEATCATGDVSYTGIAQRGEVSFVPWHITNSSRTLRGLQMGGIAALRDYPRYVALAEKGLIDLSAMATHVCRLDDFREAFEHVAYRTTLASVITFE